MAKILLVEDNEMNRDMLSRRLVRNGHEVSIATDGQQGVDMAVSERPDIILMDMSLPVIDGWEATRRIKANDATRGVPVIALTAHAMAGDSNHFELSGSLKSTWALRGRRQRRGSAKADCLLPEHRRNTC